MLLRFSLLATLLVTALAAPATAQLPCAVPGADPCLLSSAATVPVGVYDIRPRSLVVANRTITVSGSGEFAILAANITMQPGSRFVAPGSDGNVTVNLDATGAIDIQSQGTSKSRIDVSGNFGGGSIVLHSVGNLTVNGTLVANATNLSGFGGQVTLTSDTGNIVVTGDPSEGIRSLGNAQGGGGTISMNALLGSISVSTQLVAKGGDCGGSCDVDLFAALDIATTAPGTIDMGASGIGGGGTLTAFAGGNVTLAGNITLNGSSDELEGGDGGELDVQAGGNVTITGRIEMNGAGRYDTGIAGFSVDGGAGTADVTADGNIQIGQLIALSKGYGSSDDFDFDAGGNLTLAGEIDMTGDVFGANLLVSAGGLVTVSARVRTNTLVDPLIDQSVLAGGIDISGCQVNVAPLGDIIATGPGGNPFGSILIAASTGLTVAGKLTSSDANELYWRTSVPVVTGQVVPPPVVIQMLDLPCCGVSCPLPTTTTTSTTSTTSSTSTSSSTAPASTSSTTVPPTTSTTAAPTTSSTVVPTTSTVPTTTVQPTTTTSSSTVPTTTAAPTTTTSSSTSSTTSAPTTTTSTTIPPTATTSSLPTTSSTSSTTSTTTPTTLASTTTTVVPTTLVTTTSTSSTTTTVGTPTTLPPTTSSSTTLPQATTTTSTSSAPSTTSTTLPPLTCLETAVGIDAVRCRIDEMREVVLDASQDDLGGKRLARTVSRVIDKVSTLSSEPTAAKRLKKAAKQLKILSTKLNRTLSRGKGDADVILELVTLAGEAQAVLTGLAR